MFLILQLPTREIGIGVLAGLLSIWLQSAQVARGGVKSDERPFALMVGDDAPLFHPGTFVAGTPIEKFEKGTVYVIDFWASWCPPCVEGLPMMTALQKKFAGESVRIVGVAKADPQNTREIVARLVKDKGDQVGYAIMMDDSKQMFEAWMKAAGQRFIPCAFVVDRQGRIAEILQPDEKDLEGPLAGIVKGSWDLDARIKSYRAEMNVVAKGNELQDQLDELRKKKDWQGAIKVCDQLLALDAKQFVQAASDKFQILLLELKDAQQAYAFGRQAIDSVAKDDARTLNRIAYPIVDPRKNVKDKDLELARKAATRANEMAAGKGPHILQTLARIAFLEGDTSKAIELQKRATGLADADEREDFEKIAAEYEQARKP